MASSLTRRQRVALKTWTPANLQALWAEYQRKNPGAQLPSTGMAPNVGGFSPFHMPDRPPPGTYDPSIDAQVAAGQRGYGDLQQDTDIANVRSQDDFNLGRGELQRHLDEALADAGTTRTRQHQGYVDALGALDRSYTQLGNRQRQQSTQASAYGLGSSGALQQALQKRMANEAIDRKPLDQNEAAQLEDYNTLTGRLRSNFDSELGQLSLGLSRGNEDRANQLGRAGRENTQLGVDAQAQRWFQATQAGYEPPQRPAGEHGSGKKAYRYVRTPRGTRRLLSTGYLLAR